MRGSHALTLSGKGGYLSLPPHPTPPQVRSTMCQPMTHTCEQNGEEDCDQTNTQPISLPAICTFGSILYPSSSFALFCGQKLHHCECLFLSSNLPSIYSTELKVPACLVSLITRHAPCAHDHSLCDCLGLSCSCVTFQSVHKTGGYLGLTVNSNAAGSGTKTQLVRSTIINWRHW